MTTVLGLQAPGLVWQLQKATKHPASSCPVLHHPRHAGFSWSGSPLGLGEAAAAPGIPSAGSLLSRQGQGAPSGWQTPPQVSPLLSSENLSGSCPSRLLYFTSSLTLPHARSWREHWEGGCHVFPQPLLWEADWLPWRKEG